MLTGKPKSKDMAIQC